MKNITLQQMQCALEIAREGSISKAAKQLYLNQPNVSKIVNNLETELGYRIFQRSPKGITVTEKGEIFLDYAKEIIKKMEMMEDQLRDESEDKIAFSISVPRATYITTAFTQYIKSVEDIGQLDVMYVETNNNRAMDNIIHNGFNLGIIRLPKSYLPEYDNMLKANRMKYRQISAFQFHVLFSEHHPLADRESVTSEELQESILLRHPDIRAPFEHGIHYREDFGEHNRCISLTERGSQFDLLTSVPSSYMWVSPMPQEILDRYHLVQKPCTSFSATFIDLLVYHEQFMFTKPVKDFLAMLTKQHEEMEGFLE